MGDDGGQEIERDGINRRRLLKGAAAAGVGVAVWSTPSISSIGGTPVYAAECTGGTTDYFQGQRNTSCDCETEVNGVTTKYVQYKWPATSNCSQTTGGGATITPNFGNNGECPVGTVKSGNGQAGIAAITIDPIQNEFCVVRVEVWDGNCTGMLLANVPTDVVGPGGGTVNMPPVPCGSFSNTSDIFLRLVVECAVDDACLTTDY